MECKYIQPLCLTQIFLFQMTALQTAPLAMPLKRELDEKDIKPVYTSEEPLAKQVKTEIKAEGQQ